MPNGVETPEASDRACDIDPEAWPALGAFTFNYGEYKFPDGQLFYAWTHTGANLLRPSIRGSRRGARVFMRTAASPARTVLAESIDYARQTARGTDTGHGVSDGVEVTWRALLQCRQKSLRTNWRRPRRHGATIHASSATDDQSEPSAAPKKCSNTAPV